MTRTALLWTLALPLCAQWDDVRDSRVPLLPDGTPNLSAPVPKAAGGKPDLTGVWAYPVPFQEGQEPNDVDMTRFPFINIGAPLPPGALPLKPEAAALMQSRAAQMGRDHPLARCLPPGIPGNYLIPDPFKIVQTPELIVVLHEEANNFRQIFLDGRALPADPIPTWNGYSIGHWEGDTLVVETSGFNGKTWLDGLGHPVTQQMRLRERFRRLDTGHLEIEMTVDDPGAFEKPWTTKAGFVLLAGIELMEKICLENEKDREHMVGQ